MSVAADLIEDAIGTAEWRFRVDYPFTVMERRQIAGEALGIGQWLQFAVELQFPCRVGLLQITEEELPKAARQYVHGQEEAWTASHPTACRPGRLRHRARHSADEDETIRAHNTLSAEDTRV